MSVASEPQPQSANLSNWRLPPFNHWAFHHIRDVLPVAEVAKGAGTPMPLPAAPVSFDAFRLPGADGALSLEAVLAATSTDAIVILQDGRIVHEAYAHGMMTDTPHILMSATKAVVGLVAGMLAHQGRLSLDATVATCLPELADTVYRDVSLRQLLDMRSGVVLSEAQSLAYSVAAGWDPPAPGLPSGDLHGFFRSLKGEPAAHGGPFYYTSANTDLLGWAMERATGESVASLITRQLWAPMGAETAAYITTDSQGAARCTGGLCATVRDFARLGQLILDHGCRNGAEVIPPAVIEDIATGGDHQAWAEGQWGQIFGFAGSSLRYRSGWYGVDDAPPLMFAMGIHGQNLFVDRANRIVIAKFSSQPSAIDYAALPMTHRAVEAIRRYLTTGAA